MNCTGRGAIFTSGSWKKTFIAWACRSLRRQLYKHAGCSQRYWCTPGPTAELGWRQACNLGKERRQQLPLQLLWLQSCSLVPHVEICSHQEQSLPMHGDGFFCRNLALEMNTGNLVLLSHWDIHPADCESTRLHFCNWKILKIHAEKLFSPTFFFCLFLSTFLSCSASCWQRIAGGCSRFDLMGRFSPA